MPQATVRPLVPIPLVAVRVKALSDNSGRSMQMPGLLSADGIIQLLVDFFEANYTKSLSWMKKHRSSLRLFLQYLSVNPFQKDAVSTFRRFSRAVRLGTVDPETCSDESGLGWLPSNRGREAERCLTNIFDWMYENRYIEAHPNPIVLGLKSDRVLMEAAYQHRRNHAFLGHSWALNSTSSSQPIGQTRAVNSRSPRSEMVQPPRFPDSKFEELLFKGFRVRGTLDYRSILITLLMHGSGLRISEPFHLFFSDVTLASEEPARILVHHPEHGGIPFDQSVAGLRLANREAYLMARWQLQPRNRLTSVKHAGWKSVTHSSIDGIKFLPVYWFIEEYGRIFSQVWADYARQVAAIDRNHPFAFVNLRPGADCGEMLGIDGFRDSHRRAVERIGLICGKAHGTSPHGHRHAYGRRLAAAGVAEKVIMRCMHHSNLVSQAVYTGPSHDETIAALKSAGPNMGGVLK